MLKCSIIYAMHCYFIVYKRHTLYEVKSYFLGASISLFVWVEVPTNIKIQHKVVSLMPSCCKRRLVDAHFHSLQLWFYEYKLNEHVGMVNDLKSNKFSQND